MSADVAAAAALEVDDDEGPLAADTPRAKKQRTASYKKLNLAVDQTLLAHHVCRQLFNARVEAEARLDAFRTPAEVIANMRPGAYTTTEVCTQRCVVERLNVALYLCEMQTEPEAAERMRGASHMFLNEAGVAIAGRLGILSTTECARNTIHVCSPYCPFALQAAYPALFDDADAGGDGDIDRIWCNDWWHRHRLAADLVPPTIHRCTTHNLFHICGSVCQFMHDGTTGTKTCPISHATITDDMQHSFGDGVGTAEQQEKTAETRGSLDDGGDHNDRRRRAIGASRARLYEAATTIVDGVRVRRTAGVRSLTSALKRKAGKAKKITPEDQQKVIQETLSAAEVRACRPYEQRAGTVDAETKLEAIAQLPFSERVPGKFDHQFALDRMHEMLHRTRRRADFTLSDAVNRQVLFGNAHLFAMCCERAAAIFYQLHLGAQRRAIEEARYEKVPPKARKAVDVYTARCAQTGVTATLAQCRALYEATLNAQTRRYPELELSAEMYAATEAYYAARAVMFYFGLLALPVRRAGLMRPDEIETIRTAFSFESFCVVIYDLMKTGYTVGRLTLLRLDRFLLERLSPSSSVTKLLGMPEKPCTNIKGLVTMILKVAQQHGVSLNYALDTTLEWAEIAELSLQPRPAHAVVRALAQRRADQLHALRAVRPPSPERPLPSDDGEPAIANE